jgi:hypothetical protein
MSVEQHRIIDPKRLLIVDAFGAAISFVLLAFVLTSFESFFGIPKSALWTLAVPPVFFLLFDLVAIIALKKHISPALRIIAILNGLYCVTSIALVLQHSDSVTVFGWMYIIGEIAFVSALARIEWKAARGAT